MAELRLVSAKRRFMGVVLSAVAVGASLSTAPAIARTSFDGNWSVLIVTDAGSCDRAYRYALHIENGRVSYNDPSFDISGHVDAHGHVRVSVTYGQQHANGTGRISADYGTGQWSGNSSTSRCSGHWEAERRG